MPGDRVPQEWLIPDTLKASRGTLREAMKILEFQGLITSKTGPGGGAFVSAMAPADAIQLLDNLFLFEPPSIADIYAMRKLLEPELAAGLAGKLTPRGLRGAAGDDPPLRGRADDGGRGISAAPGRARLPCRTGAHCGNRILGFVCVFLLSLLRDMTVCREIYSQPNPDLRERGLHYQVQLLRAIKAGDAEQARTIMREHMVEAERYMLARAAMRGRAGADRKTDDAGRARRPYDPRQPSPFRLGQGNRAGRCHCAPGETIAFNCLDAGKGTTRRTARPPTSRRWIRTGSIR